MVRARSHGKRNFSFPNGRRFSRRRTESAWKRTALRRAGDLDRVKYPVLRAVVGLFRFDPQDSPHRHIVTRE
jgi:hypothetical protein